MIKYNGRWIDCFHVSVYDNDERPQSKGRVLLETPCGDMTFDREQWRLFKEKVNSV